VTAAPARTESGWIRRPWWDLAVLAFGWLPFFVWVAAGPLAGSPGAKAWNVGLNSALLVVLPLNFVHRQYVFLMVYGDRRAFEQRRRAYIVAPLLALAVVAGTGFLAGGRLAFVTLGALGVWNVWHVVQQRYGILRIYAGRAGGGLSSREHGRRDMALLWSSVLLLAATLVAFRTSTFAGHPEARLALQILGPLIASGVAASVFVIALSVFAWAAVRWGRAELAATPKVSRAPRLLFLASTGALLAVFVVYGPIVGYLVFAVAHSVEYLGFVHHFGERKYAPGTGARGLAAWLFGNIARSPLVFVPILAAFLLLRDHRTAAAYVVYYLTTSALHFLYDGWIWKVRRPEVAAPLELQGRA
jgi:hypothetical protein